MITFLLIFSLYWVFSFGVLFTDYILYNQDEPGFNIVSIIFGFIILLIGGGFLFPYFLGVLIVKLSKFLDNNEDRKL
jgi:hypothetical protein